MIVERSIRPAGATERPSTRWARPAPGWPAGSSTLVRNDDRRHIVEGRSLSPRRDSQSDRCPAWSSAERSCHSNRISRGAPKTQDRAGRKRESADGACTPTDDDRRLRHAQAGGVVEPLARRSSSRPEAVGQDRQRTLLPGALM